MKKSTNSTMIGLSLALFLGLTACTQYDLKTPARNTPQSPVVEPKPLPACGPTTTLHINWNQDSRAFGYVFDIGFTEYDPAWSQELGSNDTSVDYELNTRGTWYFARVTKTPVSGETRTIPLYFYLPNCAERDDWQRTHPEYVEPVQFNIAL